MPEIAEQAETLQEAITDDYTTGIVPLAKRQPTWHLQALMMNFWAGFSYVLVGFTLNEAGYTLLKSTLIILLGTAIYWVYGTAAAYIGARTGQTHALLSRSIFGVWGSVLVSLVIVFAQLGWVGFQGNLTVQIWSGLFGWGHVLLVGVLLTIAMITNNVLGFTGVATFARYIVAPLMFAWLLYLVIKAFTTEGSSVLLAHPHATVPMGFPAAITVVIGFIMWGEEPDFFRFAKPNVGAITRIYSFSLIFGFVLSGVGGWVMGQLAGTSDYGPAVKTITDYSLFGATWLAFVLVLVGQIAINDGNYYVVTNAAQNVLAAIPWWKRQYTCIIAAALGGLAAWIIPYVITSGFEKVAAVGAIGIPTATLIMVADHFAVPRMFGISRPLDQVPAWRQAGRCNWLAVVALLIATGLGGWASGLLPVSPPNVNLGVIPLETWLLGVLLYLAGISLLVRRTAPATMRALLGFSEPALESSQRHPADAIIDVVSLAGLEADLVPSYDRR